jgi:hypothetical protein
MFQSPNVMHNDHLLMAMIANPAMLLRGYLFAEKNMPTLKRSSAITMTDAEQCNGAISTLETFARSGEKTIDENKSDTTFFKKEVVGDIEYKAIGSIDLMQLQFISTDCVFDRLALNPDRIELFKEILLTKFPSYKGELGYYKITGSVVEIPEYGIKLPNDNVNFLVKEYLKRLLGFNIKKASSYATTDSAEFKLVYDPLEDTMDGDNGWVSLTQNTINELNFESHEFYSSVDTKKSAELRAELVKKAEDKVLANKVENDAKKAANATEKKSKKA